MSYLNRICIYFALGCSTLLADPVPMMPELEAFITKGEFVTQADLKASGAEVEQRLMIESYMKRLGLSEQEVRERFTEVISFVGYLGGGKFNREHYDAFKLSATLDNEDLYLRHNAYFAELTKEPDNTKLMDEMRENVLSMEQQGYSLVRVCGAAYDYRKIMNDHDDSTLEDERFLFDRYSHMLSALEMDTSLRIHIFGKFIDPFIDTKDTELRDLLIDVLSKNEGVDPWFMHMVRGVDQERVAWSRRGGQYSSKTSAEQFEAFHHHLDLSIVELRKAYEIDPLCPQTSSFMVESIYPRTSLWVDEGWTWFGRTLIACIDYEPVYDNMRHILQDKWHGDLTSRAEFAQWCARPDLAGYGPGMQGLYMLERAWWTYGVTYGNADLFWEEESDAIEAVMKSLQIRIDKGFDSDYDYEHSVLAYMESRHNRDFGKAAAHIRACKNGINPNARRKMRFDDLNIVSIVLPLSIDETAEMAGLALSYEVEDKYELALQEWERVMSFFVSANDQVAIEAIRNRIQGCKWQAAFDSRAEWVELRFDEYLSGWNAHNGKWERVDESTVRTTKNGRESEALLVADLETGYWYELQARVRMLNSQGANSTMGINYSRGNRNTDGWDQMRYLSTRIGRELAAIGWNYAGNDYSIPLPEAKDDGWYEYRLLIKGDVVEGYINDQLVGQGEHPNWKPEKEPDLIRIALGAYLLEDEIVEFTDVRVRKRRSPENLDF